MISPSYYTTSRMESWPSGSPTWKSHVMCWWLYLPCSSPSKLTCFYETVDPGHLLWCRLSLFYFSWLWCPWFLAKIDKMCPCLHFLLTGELRDHLQSFVEETNAQHSPGFIKVVRHDKQEGLIRSRVSGWRIASAPVIALFDAHVEFNTGW